MLFLYTCKIKTHSQSTRWRQKNGVEFRHKSWQNKKVFLDFKKSGIIFCSANAPNLSDALVKTTDDVYLRFHGVKKWSRHNYTKMNLRVGKMELSKYELMLIMIEKEIPSKTQKNYLNN